MHRSTDRLSMNKYRNSMLPSELKDRSVAEQTTRQVWIARIFCILCEINIFIKHQIKMGWSWNECTLFFCCYLQIYANYTLKTSSVSRIMLSRYFPIDIFASIHHSSINIHCVEVMRSLKLWETNVYTFP